MELIALAAEADGSASILDTELSVVLLVAIAALVAIGVRRVRMPYTVALVVVGLGLTFLPADLIEIEVSSDLILAVLVPPLLFEATLHIAWAKLRADLVAVLTLAVGGTLLGAFAVGAIVFQFADLPWAAAVAFGALISATDPVAVIAFFRSIGVSKRLTILVEGESLFNDGVAIVVFNLALVAAAAGTTLTVGDAFTQFILVAFGGLIVGLILGYVVASLFLKNVDDHLIETATTFALAFGAYVVAEEFGVIFGIDDHVSGGSLHLSGILAVVAAGLMVGNIGLRNTSPTTRLTLENFWQFLAFIVNSLVFLLLGLQIEIDQFGPELVAIAVAIAAVLLTRLVVVYGIGGVVGVLRPERAISTRFKHVMYWGGLRGAISVALALTLSAESFGEGVDETLQVMTFGVVLFTLLVQGTTIARLIRRVGLADRPEERLEQQRRQARVYARRSGQRELDRLHSSGALFPELWQAMRDLYDTEIERDIEALTSHLAAFPELESDMYLRARADTLRAERAAIVDAARRGIISNEVMEELTVEVNNHLAALEFIEGDAAQGEILTQDPPLEAP